MKATITSFGAKDSSYDVPGDSAPSTLVAVMAELRRRALTGQVGTTAVSITLTMDEEDLKALRAPQRIAVVEPQQR